MTYDQIIDDINEHRRINPYPGHAWYVGITNNVPRRMDEHNVPHDGGWMNWPADTADIAADVEEACIRAGFQGGTGGGREDSTEVYIYPITATTNP